jgi:hypothetical protein
MSHSRRFIALLAALTLLVQAGQAVGQETSGAAAASALVAPEVYLGHRVGADFKLADWEEITGYLAQLGSASTAVQIDTLGRSTQGRPFILAIVSAPENMARLEEIRRGQAKLADPRQLGASELDSLLESQPAVVLISNNIHSTEIASSQGVMELAYTLATDADLAATMKDVVVLLIPSMNPDGQQMVSDWYERTLGTPYEGGRMPWLYHYYAGHDNNRDFYMLTQVESRLLTDLLYRRWFPEVVYDVHQMGSSGARLFVPPFDDPLNPNIDPLIVREISLFGLQMSTDLEAAGKSGVVNASNFDLWWHGGLRSVPARHNMVGILSESASARIASPIFLEQDQLRQPQYGINFPDPWPGGWWHIRDIIDYQLIAARALIGLAARERSLLIANYVELGRRALSKGRDEPPFAYVIPAGQRDVGSAAALLEVLRRGAVEIQRAAAPFVADEVTYPAGSWVVLMAQPYRAHAKDLLERQVYPDRRLYPGGPPDAPYDVAGWTLPLQMGVDAVEVLRPFQADLQLLSEEIRPPAGRVTGSGSAFIVTNTTNAANLGVHRLLTAGGSVTFLSRPAQSGDRSWPVGSAVLQGAGARRILEELASEEGLSAQAFSGSVTGYQLEQLRVGLYQPWTASMDEGWTRWVFDGWDLPYRSLHDAEIRAGDLRARYDVIILPDLSPNSIVEGQRPGTVPSEYAGGLGDAGSAAIREFVRAGGTLICIDSSSEYAIEQLGLPISDVRPSTREQRSGEAFYAPGSILAIEIDPNHPIGYGMPERTIAYYSNSPLFEVAEDARNVTVVARYPETGQLLSGYALQPEYLSGKAALVEAGYGSGRVVLFGFRPQYRGQPHETFKILFNAIYRGASRGPVELSF